MDTVVETRHIHGKGHTALNGFLCMVEALSDGASGIETVAEVLQTLRDLIAFALALFGNFIADRPHDDTGVVTMGHDEVGEVFIRPLAEETGIAVLALGINPHVEALGHDHHTQ